MHVFSETLNSQALFNTSTTTNQQQTTYCHGMHHFLSLAGREPLLVNLDPAAEDSSLPLAPEVDVRDLVCLDEVMREHNLGPNGGLAYCMSYLAANADWLREKISEAMLAKGGGKNIFLIIDTPGQAELFSPGPHGELLLTVLSSLAKEPPHFALAAVLLLDSHLCTDGGKYLAGLLAALGAMLHLELPRFNVLSKVDNLRSYQSAAFSSSSSSSSSSAAASPLQFDIAHYASATGLRYLVHDLTSGGGGSAESGAAAAASGGGATSSFAARYAKLTAGLCEVIEDFHLLSFTPLAIEDEACVRRVATLVDRAVGWVPEAASGPSSSGSGGGSSAAPPTMVPFAAADRGGEALLENVREKYLGGGGNGGGGGGRGENGEEEEEEGDDDFFDDDE